MVSSKDVFAKGNESFPRGQSAAFYKLLVKSHGPIDARTTAAVCAERLDEHEGNARPAPAVLNRFVAALPAAPPAPANGDDAVNGDEGELRVAQPAGPAAEADAIVPTADEEESDGGQDNVEFPSTPCGQPLRKTCRRGGGVTFPCFFLRKTLPVGSSFASSEARRIFSFSN